MVRTIAIVGAGFKPDDFANYCSARDSTLVTSSFVSRRIYGEYLKQHLDIANRHIKTTSSFSFGEFRKDPNLQKAVEDVLLQTICRDKSIRQLVRVVRHLIDHLEVDWRDVINALRPVTPKLWQSLPPQERARFLRRVVPYWDVVRHRLAPLAAKRLASGIVQGRTRIGAYSIQKVEALQNGLAHVTAKRRGTGALDSFKVVAIINCIGPTYDIRRTGNALVSFLKQSGILHQDEVKIGFRLGPDYTVNPGYPNLHYIGPMLKATFWEAIVVPELRVHSANLAQKVLAGADERLL
jgi:uncharacterized NAD(P)/FAD-binding protein YdhS